MFNRFHGKVKSYDVNAHNGFIRADDGRDVFFEYSDIENAAYHVPKNGERVEFSIEEGPKGIRASQIVLSGSSDDSSTYSPGPYPAPPKGPDNRDRPINRLPGDPTIDAPPPKKK